MNQWKGIALGPSFPQGRSDCLLSLKGIFLVARFPDGQEIPVDLAEIDFSIRGYETKEIYFTSRRENGIILTTTELVILDEIHKLSIPGFEKTFAGYKNKERRKWMKHFIIPAGLLLLVVVGLPYLLLGPGVDLLVHAIPTSVDRDLGNSAFESSLIQITGGKPVFIKDPKILSQISKIVDPLIKPWQGKEFKFEIHLVKHPMVNAFALPGGKIVIMTGLLEKASSPEEVAGVVAHEISHVTERHGLKQMVKNIGIWGIVLVVVGDSSSLGNLIALQSASLVSMGFSRGMEREADENGFQLLKQARFDPSGLKTFFEKLKKEEEEKMGRGEEKMLQFFSTHPLTSERMKYLDEMLQKQGKGSSQVIDIDWPELQKKLKKTDELPVEKN